MGKYKNMISNPPSPHFKNIANRCVVLSRFFLPCGRRPGPHSVVDGRLPLRRRRGRGQEAVPVDVLTVAPRLHLPPRPLLPLLPPLPPRQRRVPRGVLPAVVLLVRPELRHVGHVDTLIGLRSKEDKDDELLYRVRL